MRTTAVLPAAQEGKGACSSATRVTGAQVRVEDVYEAHVDFVWRTARRLGVREQYLDDVVQEVFVVVQRRLNEFEGRSEVKTWLFGITRRVARAHFRQNARRPHVLPSASGELVDASARCAESQLMELEGRELSADARAVLAATRSQNDPSAEDRARLREKLASRWAAVRVEQAQAHLAEHATPAAVHGGTSLKWLLLASSAAFFVSMFIWIALHRQVVRPARKLDAERVEGSRSSADPHLPQPPAAAVAFRQAPDPARLALSEPAERLPRADTRRVRPARARTPTPSPDTAPPSSAAAADPSPTERAPQRHAPQQPASDPGSVPSASNAVGPSALDAASAVHERAPAGRIDSAAPTQRAEFVPQPIDDELVLLGAAQDALRRGQPTLALRLVEHHAFRYPRGALARERIAVQMLALCALGRRMEARQMLHELTQLAASSPLLERVRRSCGLE
jgi:RNA polymerase sigma factor (sigma-70 family)